MKAIRLMHFLLCICMLLSACGGETASAPETAPEAAPILSGLPEETAQEPEAQDRIEASEPTEAAEEECENQLPLILKPQIGEFFFLVDGIEPMADIYGIHYGFPDDYSEGCSAWCAVSDHEESVQASSVLPPQGGITYDASHLSDGSRDTVWVEGADGYGLGESITMTRKYNEHGGIPDQKFVFLSLCIVNGYIQTEKKWTENSRVKYLDLWFNGNYICMLELEDTMSPQYFELSELELSALSGEESTFRFEIVDVYPGTRYEDTAITGIEIEFRTPNH